jgi:AraC-like DNA-binding protein
LKNGQIFDDSAIYPDILVKLFIKNMTTVDSTSEVKVIVERHGFQLLSCEFGEIDLTESLSSSSYKALKNALLKNGFDIILGRDSILTEKVKNVIIEMIHYSDELPEIKYSNYISNKLKTNYTYLSKIFSKVKNITIEHFIITHKIERVKQLLLYHDLSLSEIAWKLHYSSTAHLSAQFKKVTGLTPSLFKKLRLKKLMPPESL